MEYYSVIKKKILSFLTSMDLEGNMLTEINLTERQTLYDLSYM